MEICINCINDKLGSCAIGRSPITNKYGEGLGCSSFYGKDDNTFICSDSCDECDISFNECKAPWKYLEFELSY